MEEEKLLYFLSKKLVIYPSVKVTFNVQFYPCNTNLSIDAVVKNGNESIYVEMKRRITLESIFRFNSYKDLVRQQGITISKFVFLTVFVGNDVKDIAKKLEIIIIQLPHSLLNEITYDNPRYSPSKITSKKSFDVIYEMLSKGPSTIMDLSQASGVSYGWAHGIVTRLMEIGIVQRKFGLYKIVNIDKLLDSIAYERPIGSINSKEYWTNSDDILKFARDVSSTATIKEAKVALMGPTASILYDPHYVKSDTLYLYVEPHQIVSLADELHLGRSGNLKVLAYLPDRDVFADSKTLDGVTLTSQKQLLLDLAS
ncbi:MAG: hypothetical protein ACYDDC_06245, partial [Thermoplasmataceae archaeon]